MDLNYDQIASKLISDNLLLTALELHLELIEAGRELSKLKEYFSNPGNFERQASRIGDLATSIARSHSQATLDSLDISRLSEDEVERGAVDERVAVLEFELRKAKECISALRANLTEATATSESESAVTSNEGSSETAILKRHEQRALNFLVNEYLLLQGYRLTAVTFSEENENQDFEDWDDVGLNIPRPPELTRLYREGCIRWSRETACTQGCQTEGPWQLEEAVRDDTELIVLREEFESLKEDMIFERKRFENLQVDLEKEKCNVEDLQRSLKILEDEKLQRELTRESEQGSSNGTSEQFEMLEHAPVEQEWTKIDDSRKVPSEFRKELYSILNVSEHVTSTSTDVISQLTDLLPKILLSLPSNRKEDLIPLISTSARLHSESEQASRLVSLLLSLRKRPQENERKAIISGVCDLAVNPNTVENHLLPQIWDLAGVKVVEKRLLVAEICGALAPLTSDLIRKSQLLPLLQTLMLEAGEEEIKISIVQNLSILISYLNDSDKYLQCEELCFLALKDPYFNVQSCTVTYLLPIISQWAFQIEKLENNLIERLISALKNDPENINLINSLINILPYLLIYIGKNLNFDCNNFNRHELLPLFQSLNNPEIFFKFGSISIVNNLCNYLNLSEDFEVRPELGWVNVKFIPELYSILCSLSINNEEVIILFVKLFHFICKGFGFKFTQTFIKPIFMNGLKNFEEAVSKIGAKEDLVVSALLTIPVLLVSILTTGEPEDTRELSETLRHLLVSLPACNLPVFPLKVSLPHLCRAAALQESVVLALMDASRNSRAVVRLRAAQLLLPCVATLQETTLLKHALPALSMLSSDNDGEVREATIALFAELIAISTCKEAQMQSRASLQAFLKDSPGNVTHTMSLALTKALGRIITNCDPAFREDVVLPHLHHLAVHCSHGCSSQTRKMDLALALVGSLASATQVPISKHNIATYLVPALRHLETITAQCLSVHHDSVSCWLHEAESRCSSQQSTPTTPTSPAERVTSPVSSSQLMQSAVHSATAAGRRSVEDVKQKVTNLLRKK